MRKYVLYSAKLEREDKFLAIGAQGPVFAPAKPAFPPSMAVAEPRISCHAVAAKPARQGWHAISATVFEYILNNVLLFMQIIRFRLRVRQHQIQEDGQ